MLAKLLYYTLTTGSGAQTLGEEYCDILQVSGHFLAAVTSFNEGDRIAPLLATIRDSE